MMEALGVKRRLEFRNPAVQVQTVWKLYSEVVKKKPKDSKISEKSPQILELQVLWDGITSDEPVVSETSSKALLELVYSGYAEYEYLLNGLLNIVPSTKNLKGIINGIGELLIIQVFAVEKSGKEYACPYQLRSPTHPFITVLTNKPNSWKLLVEQVQRFGYHEHSSIKKNCCTILAPFIKFVFLEPKQSEDYVDIRINLHRSMLQMLNQSEKSVQAEILGILVKLLPIHQVVSQKNLALFSMVTSEILSVQRVVHGNKIVESKVADTLTVCFQMCEECLKKNVDCSSMIRILFQMATSKPQVFCREHLIVHLANLISTSVGDDVCYFLKTLRIILQQPSIHDFSSLVLCIPVFSLLRAHSICSLGKNDKTTGQISSLCSEILKMIYSLIKEPKKGEKAYSDVLAYQLTKEGYISERMVTLCHTLHDEPEYVSVWLCNVKECLQKLSSIPDPLLNVITSFFMLSHNQSHIENITNILTDLASLDPTKSPDLLPLLLYKIKAEKDPDVYLLLMEAIPKLATHKFTVPPVLRTIQLMGSTTKLKPITVKLLTDLWIKEDRCFPQLLEAINENISYTNPLGMNEILVAKAAAMKEICERSPEKHGVDLLQPLSEMLNSCKDASNAAAAALALEAISSLCEAEVINIKSTWTVLESNLSQENRPVVIQKICHFMSLVPELSVRNTEYEEFLTGVVRSLWLYILSGNDTVTGAAYKALSSFSVDNFKLTYLPKKVTSDFLEQAKELVEKEEDKSLTIDSVIPFVPGVCYIRLLKDVGSSLLMEFRTFLSSMVSNEVENLPRGIYHPSTRRQTSVTGQNKIYSAIPAFILTQYEKTKQPGLRPGLAAGLLFCYDPPLDVGRDGKPRKHHIVKHSRNYLQMFETLLHEVPVQPSEWHRSLLIPQAWTLFVQRLFTAMIEGRKAEITLQIRQKELHPDDAKLQEDLAWLKTRDTLTETIKIASRGNPTKQANSLYALSALISVIHIQVSNLATDVLKSLEKIKEHATHIEWLTITIDTIMSVTNIKFKPQGELLGLCQQYSSDDRLLASTLVRASSCTSFSQLVPVLISKDKDRIQIIIETLSSGLPGSSTADESPVVQSQHGLGLGAFLGRLFEEHYSDIAGQKGNKDIWKALNTLEECCYNSELDNRSGSILGLGIALCGLCEEGKTDSRVHVLTQQEKLSELLMKSEVTLDIYQALCTTVACVTGRGYSTTILSSDSVNMVIDQLQTVHKNNPQTSAVCLALGMLCYSLSRIGHPTITDTQMSLFETWKNDLTDENCVPLQKVSSLNGLLALAGSERSLIPVENASSVLGRNVAVSDIIKLASQIVCSDDDFGIRSNSAWMLGHLYSSTLGGSETRLTVPQNYNYLPESSVLRGVVDFLVEAGKCGPETIPTAQVLVALRSLVDDSSEKPLPPVNWTAVLSPLMRCKYGDSVNSECLSIAARQSKSSPTAVAFLSSWLTPTLFTSLAKVCHIELSSHLPVLLKSLPLSTISSFLQQLVDIHFKDLSQGDNDCGGILDGFKEALAVTDLPENKTTILYEYVEKLYKCMNNVTDKQEMYCLMSECLTSVPDEIFDKITENDLKTPESFEKGAFVRCYLIAKGLQPIALLNSLLDATFNNPYSSQRQEVFHYVVCCFYQCNFCKSELNGPVKRVQWLVELMGHVKNMAHGLIEQSEKVTLKEAVELGITIAAAAICLWTSFDSGPIMGFPPSYFTDANNELLSCGLELKSQYTVNADVLSHLPAFISRLDTAPWDQILSKVIDWMMTMCELPDTVLEIKTRNKLKASLLSLRHCAEFQKIGVWTKAVAMTV